MKSLKQILNYGSRTIEYDVITSKRVKTSEIIVDENKIVVRTPMNKSLEESRKMVESKAVLGTEDLREYMYNVQGW